MSQRKPAPVWMMAVAPSPAAAPSGCHACQVAPLAQCPPLQPSGTGTDVARVLTALRAVRNPETGIDIVSEGWIASLDVGADEAVLGLWARVPGCRALRAIAEDVFNALRGALPDTDLYVRELRLP